MSFSALEAALKAWVVSATGLTSDRVIQANDRVPAKAMPYATILLPMPQRVGGAFDEVRHSYDGAAAAGQEIVFTVVGQRESVARLQFFAQATAGDGTARDHAMAAVLGLHLPSIRDALDAAGLVYVSVEGTFDFSERAGPAGQSRAALDVRFRWVETRVERTGYIAAYQATAQIDPGGSSIPLLAQMSITQQTALSTYLQELKAWLDTLRLPTDLGPTDPPTTPSPAVP